MSDVIALSRPVYKETCSPPLFEGASMPIIGLSQAGLSTTLHAAILKRRAQASRTSELETCNFRPPSTMAASLLEN